MASILYPVGMLMAVGTHLMLTALGWSAMLCAYGIVLTAALGITMLERVFPARQQWLPDWKDVRQDTAFMVAIQIAFPKLLGLATVQLLLEIAPPSVVGLWPHDSPIWLQALWMLLLADLFRYWLHRAAHKIPWLWKFHAVHHSPKKLYWINVGRFHPVDKGLQFIFDALPFIILGVNEQVLALYFVFYAVNGFFQHCNINLHFGWLNYVVSSAELHRWHHSRLKSESDQNYGNNLIIWDMLFGTRFLPADRKVSELGLTVDTYPDSFWRQMIEPFKRRD